jgi:hypothetical protein
LEPVPAENPNPAWSASESAGYVGLDETAVPASPEAVGIRKWGSEVSAGRQRRQRATDLLAGLLGHQPLGGAWAGALAYPHRRCSSFGIGAARVFSPGPPGSWRNAGAARAYGGALKELSARAGRSPVAGRARCGFTPSEAVIPSTRRRRSLGASFHRDGNSAGVSAPAFITPPHGSNR